MRAFLQGLPLSELQLSLLAAGLIAVILVWGVNLWQERRHRTQAQRIFRGEQGDALMGGAPERIEPAIADPVDASPAAPSAAAGASVEPVDETIDCIVRLDLPEPVDAARFLAAGQRLLGPLAGRVRWFGREGDEGGNSDNSDNSDDESAWRSVGPADAAGARQVRHLRGALQIADRNGPVVIDDLDLYVAGARALAAEFGAQAQVPDVPTVLAQAQALDDFCAGVDWRLALNLVHRNGLSLPLAGIAQLAEVAGMCLGDDRIFHATDDAGQILFALADSGGAPFAAGDLHGLTTQGVTLVIDVPRVADGAAAFDRMLALAGRISPALDAMLVDDQRKALSDGVLAMIRAKIGEFQQKMAGRDIPAGSRRALRLYS